MPGKTIVLTGHGGSQNRGCQAIVQCTIGLIRKYLRGARVICLSRNPESDRRAMTGFLGAGLFTDYRPQWPSRYTWQWLLNAIARRMSRGSIPAKWFMNRRFYGKADVLISVGGDNFTEDYGAPTDHFEELRFARAQGAKTVIWAASIGPFRSAEDEIRWAKELRSVDLITVREDITLEYLKGLGVSENVHRVADPAFLLPACGDASLEFRNGSRPTLVGLGMSALIGHYCSGGSPYYDAFRNFAKRLLTGTDVSIVLVPHVTGSAPYCNDHAICAKLAEDLCDPVRVRVLPKSLGAPKMKQAIGQCDYFIGARTHSTIASLSCLVPTLSVAYSNKAYGLNQDVFGHTDYVMDVRNMSADRITEGYQRLGQERAQIVLALKRRIPTLRNMAEHGGRLLVSLCNGVVNP